MVDFAIKPHNNASFMDFNLIPTEQTTAATDLLLSFFCASVVIFIRRVCDKNTLKIKLWTSILSLLAVAALLGAFIHGLVVADELKRFLAGGLNFSLGLTVALFAVVVIADLWGENAARRALPILVLIGVGFFILRLFSPGSFLGFIIYQSVAMLFALAGYSYLLFKKKRVGLVNLCGFNHHCC